MWLLVLAVAVALVAWLAILLWSGWVRPLRRLRDQVLALSRGEWNRLLLSEPLPGELWTVLLRLEGLRRALLDRLRSSTELNLQLEGEVARRSAELSRRNAELKQAVASLQQARDELVRRERLAAVGSVVASLTSEINNPVSSMVALVAPLKDAHAELTDCLGTLSQDQPLQPAARQRALKLLDEQREMVSLLLRGGRRVRDVVRAMRGYVNLGSREAVAVPLLPLLVDVYQLFADRLRPRLIDRREPSPISSELRPAMLLVAPLSVQVVRSELSILLSRWLLRTVARLTPEHRVCLTLQPVPSSTNTPLIELRIEDDGPPLDRASLLEWQELHTVAAPPFFVDAQSQSADCSPEGMTTELKLLLPLATGVGTEPPRSEPPTPTSEPDTDCLHR